MFEIKPYGVYVKADSSSRITAVNSDAFLSDLTGWTKIDTGYGDKFHHAQNNYFPEPIRDEYGVYRYKLVNGEAVERTVEEMGTDVQEPAAPESDAATWDELAEAIQEGVDAV